MLTFLNMLYAKIYVAFDTSFGYNINEDNYILFHHIMSPVTVPTGR